MRKSIELPGGFYYWADFISGREELELVKAMEKLKFQNVIYLQRGYAATRQAVQYGIEYSVEAGRFLPGSAIPEFLGPLQNKIAESVGLEPESLAEVFITKYPAGSGIGWHRDEGPFEEVAGVSLWGSCTMGLRNRLEKRKGASIVLAPRSAFVLRGPARWEWEHRISATRSLRYSIIFRRLRKAQAPGR